jgi:glucosamine--fructose-6-phosphate aminotransferase (isomerizing)
MTLLHVKFQEYLPARDALAVLAGYRTRYGALRDAVTEVDPAFDESRLAEIPIVDLLTEPVYALARRLRPKPQ